MSDRIEIAVDAAVVTLMAVFAVWNAAEGNVVRVGLDAALLAIFAIRLGYMLALPTEGGE